ncbi:MAG TPA: zf-HC2 domain-containing protein [Blastocatellia bacterium]
MFSKKQDQAIDNLLRTRRGEQPGPHQVCQEFDPDLANTYIERAMAPAESVRFERHLSVCTPCRRGVAALARLALAEETPASFAAPATLGRPRLASLFGQMRAPQWAMAAAVVLLVAIAVPVLLSWGGAQTDLARNSVDETNSAAGRAAQSTTAAAPPATLQPESASAPGLTAVPGEQNLSADRSQTRQQAGGTVELDRELQTAEPAQTQEAAGEKPAKTDTMEQRQQETQAAPIPVTNPVSRQADTQTQSGLQSQTVVPQQQAAEPPLPQINREQAARLPETSKDSAQVTTLRPGRADGDGRVGKEETIRSNSGFTPPSEAESKRKARGALAEQPGALPIADPSRAERSAVKRPEERKVNGKTFWLRDGVWTDKNYKPAKKRVVVQFVRDSEAYSQLLAKYPELNSYLQGLPGEARVIVVYKDVVYRIDPAGK